MRILFITLLVLVMQGCKGQDSTYFEVQKVSCNILGHESTGLKIVLKNAPTTACSYDPALFKNRSESEILQMVEELLSFQGDTALCVLK